MWVRRERGIKGMEVLVFQSHPHCPVAGEREGENRMGDF